MAFKSVFKYSPKQSARRTSEGAREREMGYEEAHQTTNVCVLCTNEDGTQALGSLSCEWLLALTRAPFKYVIVCVRCSVHAARLSRLMYDVENVLFRLPYRFDGIGICWCRSHGNRMHGSHFHSLLSKFRPKHPTDSGKTHAELNANMHKNFNGISKMTIRCKQIFAHLLSFPLARSFGLCLSCFYLISVPKFSREHFDSDVKIRVCSTQFLC